jgi:hypothetical protein
LVSQNSPAKQAEISSLDTQRTRQTGGCRLRPKIAELLRDFPAWRREKFVFQSRPGLLVLGYLLTPRASAPPHPAMVCIPSHGRGVDDIVGINARRVGCMGISGGGACTTFASALEPRIRAAMIGGYLNIDNYVPGVLDWAELYDVAGLIAPRPLFAESGTKDDIFPIEASKASFARVKKVYETFGAARNVQQKLFEGERSFHGVRGLPFLAQRLA